MISPKTIEEVFEAAIIEDVISEFLVLKKSGANYKGLSPFSNEKTPSFMVSPSKRIWKDFSSGKGGNVVSFLMEHEKYTYPEAIKYLAKKYNIEIQETQSDSDFKEDQEQKESTMLLIEFSSKFFIEQLNNSKHGKNDILPYLKNRGVSQEMINKFELGFSPYSKQELSNLVLQKGFKKEIIKKSGLFLERNNLSLIDRFTGRLIFPIHNLLGRKVGFAGRILNEDQKTAKYINSPETSIYQKSKLLYGLNFAKSEIIKENECYLVEGYTDVISLHQQGITNVVASSGTAITIDQVRLIKRFTENISFIFDSDDAGKKATYRGVDLFLSEGMFPNIIVLPDGEDPDLFSKRHTYEELLSFFNSNKKDFISFKFELELKENNTVKNKIKLVESILNSIALVPNITSQTIYIQLAAEKLNIDQNILFEDLENKKKKIQKKQSYNIKPINIDKSKKSPLKDSIEENTLSRLLLNYGKKYISINSKKISVAELIINELNVDGISFSFNIFKKIIKEYQVFISKGEVPDIHYFIQHKDTEIAKVTSELMVEKHKIDSWDKKNIRVKREEEILNQLVEEALIRFKLKRIEEMKQTILKNMSSINDEDNKKLELIKFNKLNILYRELYKKIGREC
tara:strand:+ start:2925 stop:4808 length:1884 start_codon:yes stop_codon:yes gene_type:complete